jgi:uncharacterized membrane protein
MKYHVMQNTFIKAGLILLFLSGIVSVNSCKKENEEDLFPCTDTDTTGVISYVNDIVPVIRDQCYTCHSGLAQLGGSIILDNHTAFSAYGTLVVTAISRQPNEPKFMPQGGSKLTDCFIQKLQVWINRGSNNN